MVEPLVKPTFCKDDSDCYVPPSICPPPGGLATPNCVYEGPNSTRLIQPCCQMSELQQSLQGKVGRAMTSGNFGTGKCPSDMKSYQYCKKQEGAPTGYCNVDLCNSESQPWAPPNPL